MTTDSQKLLLIEDDRDQIGMYKFKFEKEGFSFLSARNGREGIELAKSEQPDIILLDLILINESGIDVLKQLKASADTQNIPVIMLTNLAKNDMKLQSESLGAVDFIMKTQITPGELVQKVNQRLKR